MLIGFNTTKSNLLTSYKTQKLHHAILLNGKKGIGKSSFAKEFILEILNSKNINHPDLFLIEKDPEKREIGVDKIRQIANFINQTSAISPSKFILINSACELNKSSSNALLKILEEPHQNNFLILISHNISKILPTIRSRCQIINIPDLSKESFKEILLAKSSKIPTNQLDFLSEICDNSPSTSLNLGLDLIKVYEDFLNSFTNKKISPELLKKISDKNFSFLVFEKVFEFFISRLVKFTTIAQNEFFFNEKEIFINLTNKFSSKEIFFIADESLILLHKTVSLNLDKKLCILNIFNRFFYKK